MWAGGRTDLPLCELVMCPWQVAIFRWLQQIMCMPNSSLFPSRVRLHTHSTSPPVKYSKEGGRRTTLLYEQRQEITRRGIIRDTYKYILIYVLALFAYRGRAWRGEILKTNIFFENFFLLLITIKHNLKIK